MGFISACVVFLPSLAYFVAYLAHFLFQFLLKLQRHWQLMHELKRLINKRILLN